MLVAKITFLMRDSSSLPAVPSTHSVRAARSPSGGWQSIWETVSPCLSVLLGLRSAFPYRRAPQHLRDGVVDQCRQRRLARSGGAVGYALIGCRSRSGSDSVVPVVESAKDGDSGQLGGAIYLWRASGGGRRVATQGLVWSVDVATPEPPNFAGLTRYTG